MNQCFFSIIGLLLVEKDKLLTGCSWLHQVLKKIFSLQFYIHIKCSLGPDEARSNLSKACVSQLKVVLLLRKHIDSYKNRMRNLHLNDYYNYVKIFMIMHHTCTF